MICRIWPTSLISKCLGLLRPYLPSTSHGLQPLPCCCCCCQVTSVVSDSVWLHRQQPTRLPRPWDSPGKNTKSGLPFPSPMHGSEKWKWSHSVVSNSVQPHGLQPTRLLRPWDFPGKSTGVGCHWLLRLSVDIPKWLHYHLLTLTEVTFEFKMFQNFTYLYFLHHFNFVK